MVECRASGMSTRTHPGLRVVSSRVAVAMTNMFVTYLFATNMFVIVEE